MEEKTEEGTLLAPENAALVFHPDGKCEFMVPHMPDDSDVSEGTLIAASIFMAINAADPRIQDFVREFCSKEKQ